MKAEGMKRNKSLADESAFEESLATPEWQVPVPERLQVVVIKLGNSTEKARREAQAGAKGRPRRWMWDLSAV